MFEHDVTENTSNDILLAKWLMIKLYQQKTKCQKSVGLHLASLSKSVRWHCGV